jgi:hypothetical protein
MPDAIRSKDKPMIRNNLAQRALKSPLPVVPALF